MNGILLINKPQGWTSFDVIAKLRGILHMKRLGHAGTLDPMATGVLPVFVGYATKACGMLPDQTKVYAAEFQLGKISDTQDSTGAVQETGADLNGITCEDIRRHFPVGQIEQIPPMYSAVKVGGRKLYDLARQGKEIERKPRPVIVDAVDCTDYDLQTGSGRVIIHCQTGTYVRTLIHDMGQALGCGAVMTALRRDVSSGFLLADCHTLEEVQAAANAGTVEALIIPTAQAFQSLPAIHLNAGQTRLYRNGVKLELTRLGGQITDADRYTIFDGTDGFLGTAITDRENGILRVERNLCEPKEASQ